MSLSVSPVRVISTVSTLAQKAPAKEMMQAFSEAVVSPQNNKRGQIVTIILNKLVENVMKKPDADRNLFDYLILVTDKVVKLNPKIYAS